MEWIHWRERVPTWTYPTTGAARFSQLIIPTLDSTRYEYLLSLVHSVSKVGLVDHQNSCQMSCWTEVE